MKTFTKTKARKSALGEAHEVARKLAALDKCEDIAVFGPRVLDIMRGVSSSAWVMLDEKPGLFGRDFNDRFFMLRRVRNNAEYGRQLFDGLKRD